MNRPISIDKFRDSAVDEVRVIQVIEVKTLHGDGLSGKDPEGNDYTPSRIVTEYYTLEGERLAINDILGKAK